MTLVITGPALSLVSEEGYSVQRARASYSREALSSTANAVVGSSHRANTQGKKLYMIILVLI